VTDSAERQRLVDRLARMILRRKTSGPLRVAFDGPDAAGKTTLADDVGTVIAALDRPVIRASIDGFHRPRHERYRQGEHSPRGYYEDSFDYRTLRALLLDPLGPGGDRNYRTRHYDYRAERADDVSPAIASEQAVLLFDGVFLLRPEIADAWELTIFVMASFGEILRRARERDVQEFGSVEDVLRRYRTRYIPGQRLYFTEVKPQRIADVVIINDDPARPRFAHSS
jgi:uridine kinase